MKKFKPIISIDFDKYVPKLYVVDNFINIFHNNDTSYQEEIKDDPLTEEEIQELKKLLKSIETNSNCRHFYI